MKKKRKILLLLVALIGIGAGSLFAWQWNNIKALQYWATMDAGGIGERTQENDRALQSILSEYQLDETELTQGALNAIANGETVDQAADDVLAKDNTLPSTTPLSSTPPSSTPEVGKAESTSAPSGLVDNTEKIRTEIARMYVLKATFIAKLETVIASAQSDYMALEASKRTTAAKYKIMQSRTGELSALEAACDKEVAAVVDELRRLLRESGKDASLADQVSAFYQEEKSLKKAYYIKELNSG